MLSRAKPPIFPMQTVYDSTRMARDSATSVANGYGQAHDLANVSIACGSLFNLHDRVPLRTSDFNYEELTSLAG
jgi:hypothetical protein